MALAETGQLRGIVSQPASEVVNYAPCLSA